MGPAGASDELSAEGIVTEERTELKVLFYFEGDGRGLRGKRARKFERQGFQRCRHVELTRRPEDADIIYVRNTPERTRDEHLERMKAFLESYPETTVLNHPHSFLRHDSKDRTLEIWRTAGIQVPDYLISPGEDDLVELARSHPRLLCRVNNRACGDDLVLLDHPGESGLKQTLARVSAWVEESRAAGRGDTRVMAVAFADSTDRWGFLNAGRVFTVGDMVYGGFVLISHEPVVNFRTSLCSTRDEVAAFLYHNSRLDSLLEDRSFCDLMLQAVQLVGLDVGCVDFVFCGDDICLLEANSLWTPSFSWAGGKQGRNGFRHNQDLWRRQARAYCHWMDRVAFYEGMYAAFTQFAQVG
jgi:hypothetical protein